MFQRSSNHLLDNFLLKTKFWFVLLNSILIESRMVDPFDQEQAQIVRPKDDLKGHINPKGECPTVRWKPIIWMKTKENVLHLRSNLLVYQREKQVLKRSTIFFISFSFSFILSSVFESKKVSIPVRHYPRWKSLVLIHRSSQMKQFEEIKMWIPIPMKTIGIKYWEYFSTNSKMGP